MVGGVQPGAEFGGYRIEAVEREDSNVAVLLRARRVRVARSPCTSRANRRGRSRPCASSSAPTGWRRRAPEPARRLRHAHARGPRGRRRRGAAGPAAGRAAGRRPARPRAAIRIARQVASAVDALEEAGAAPPPLIAERIWVDPRGDAHLDGLDAHLGGALPAASSSASLARLLEGMLAHPRRDFDDVADPRRQGAYLSAGQFSDELRRVEVGTARRRRDTALTVTRLRDTMLIVILIALVAATSCRTRARAGRIAAAVAPGLARKGRDPVGLLALGAWSGRTTARRSRRPRPEGVRTGSTAPGDCADVQQRPCLRVVGCRSPRSSWRARRRDRQGVGRTAVEEGAVGVLGRVEKAEPAPTCACAIAGVITVAA